MTKEEVVSDHVTKGYRDRLDEGRRAMAHLIHVWHERNGWSHKVLPALADALDLGRVHNSQISNLRNGKLASPGPEVFLALGQANAILDAGLDPIQEHLAEVHPDLLKVLKVSAVPVISANGKPLGAGQLLEIFVGLAPLPPGFDWRIDPMEAAALSAALADCLCRGQSWRQCRDQLMSAYPVGKTQRRERFAAIEAVHVDWQSGAQIPGQATPANVIRQMDLEPQAVTAALIGVKSRLQVFGLQRSINEYPQEPLLAILPGVALQELWQIVSIAETALIAVSAMVVITALIGMMATIFSSLNERRREMAIFRAMGARPRVVLGLLVLEAALMAAIGAILGLALLYVGLFIGQPLIDNAFGLWLPIEAPTMREVWVLLSVVAASAIVSTVPALRAYRMSLADGMIVKT